jgi:hypothetical protein
MRTVLGCPFMFLLSLMNARAQDPSAVCLLLNGCQRVNALQFLAPESSSSISATPALKLVEIWLISL